MNDSWYKFEVQNLFLNLILLLAKTGVVIVSAKWKLLIGFFISSISANSFPLVWGYPRQQFYMRPSQSVLLESNFLHRASAANLTRNGQAIIPRPFLKFNFFICHFNLSFATKWALKIMGMIFFFRGRHRFRFVTRGPSASISSLISYQPPPTCCVLRRSTHMGRGWFVAVLSLFHLFELLSQPFLVIKFTFFQKMSLLNFITIGIQMSFMIYFHWKATTFLLKFNCISFSHMLTPKSSSKKRHTYMISKNLLNLDDAGSEEV